MNMKISKITTFVLVLVTCSVVEATPLHNEFPIDVCNVSKVNISAEHIIISTNTEQQGKKDLFSTYDSPHTTMPSKLWQNGTAANWSAQWTNDMVTTNPKYEYTSSAPLIQTNDSIRNGSYFDSYLNNAMKNCVIDFNEMFADSILVNVLFAKGINIYSYLYLESLDPLSDHATKYVLFQFTSQACALCLENYAHRLHVRDAYIKIEVASKNTKIFDQRCLEIKADDNFIGSALPECDIVKYDEVRQGSSPQLFVFDLHCPVDCTCSLGNRNWTKDCADSKFDILLIYEGDVRIVSFDNSNLNYIKHDAFHMLHMLELLSIDENRISVLHVSTFHGLNNLKVLKLRMNEIISIQDDLFQGLFQLQALDISSNLLKTLPTIIFHDLVGLNVLYLDENNLVKIPEGLFNNSVHLHLILLRLNELRQLPSTVFSGLSELQILDLSYNYLRITHSGTFSGLNNLQLLFMNHNQISSLPDFIFQDLGNLNWLDLSYNFLYFLPPQAFAEIHNLFALNIKQNQLLSLSADLFDIVENFVDLNLQHNNILKIPKHIFSNMTSLQRLDASKNNITDLYHHVFDHLEQLQYLNLSHNHLNTFPSLRYVTRLEIADLSYNKVTQLNQDTFGLMPKLIFLSLEHNAIVDLPQQLLLGLPNLELLNLQSNRLQDLRKGVLKTQRKLVSLIAANNRLENLNEKLFLGLTKLKILKIQENNIAHIPRNLFNDAINLTFINVTHNHISRVDPVVFEPTSIKTLDLRDNGLSFVTFQSFAGLDNSTILVDNSATCCFTKSVHCIPTNSKPVYLTCHRMLNSVLYNRLCGYLVHLQSYAMERYFTFDYLTKKQIKFNEF